MNRANYQPPKPVYQAWYKTESTIEAVKADMKICGYRDISHARDLSDDEATAAERCMSEKGYKLDLSSYRPYNCYGNAPYFCKALWGGRRPVVEPENR